jgi:hypothetical protein
MKPQLYEAFKIFTFHYPKYAIISDIKAISPPHKHPIPHKLDYFKA